MLWTYPLARPLPRRRRRNCESRFLAIRGGKEKRETGDDTKKVIDGKERLLLSLGYYVTWCGRYLGRKNRTRRSSPLNGNKPVVSEFTDEKTSAGGNKCHLHLLDDCTWPQCNRACPKLINPYTGNFEVDNFDSVVLIDPGFSKQRLSRVLEKLRNGSLLTYSSSQVRAIPFMSRYPIEKHSSFYYCRST